MKSVSLGQLINGRNNNFNLIRFIAALMVIYGHSYPLTGHPTPVNQFGYSCGSIAVDIFFVTSGFLVTNSLLSRYDFAFFTWSRFLRIFPALLVNLLFCVFVIGPLFTTLPTADYYLNRQTAAFLAKNLFMFFGEEGKLPGVFKNNHFEPYVNGSLWTLPYEVKMYASIAVLGLLVTYLKRDNFVKFFTLASTGIAGLLLAIMVFKFLKHHDPIHIHPHFRLGSMFFNGVCFWAFKGRIRMATLPFLGCLAALIIFAPTTNLLFIPYMLTIGYIIFYLAYIPDGFLRKFNELPDYSYGLYIYSFPIQQALSAMYPSLTVLKMFLPAVAITLVLAAFSWHIIEKPALILKKLFLPAR